MSEDKAKGRTPPKGRPTRGRAAARLEQERLARRRRWAVGAVVVIGVAVLGGVITGAALLSGDGEPGVARSDGFDLPVLDGGEGERVELAAFEGAPVVVNFFASWCTTCDAELPDFDRIAEQLDGEVEFVFVNANEDGDWRPMAERNGILDQTLAKDVGADNNDLYRAVGGTVGMPITAFYDENGQLVNTVLQGMTYDSVNAELQERFGISA